MTNKKRTAQGLTLIELVITIAVAGILLGLAVPSFSEMIEQNRMASLANQMITALNLARSEAVKRGIPVDLKATAPSSADEWGNGWTAWVDLDQDHTMDSGEPLLLQMAGVSAGMTLDSQSNSTLYSFRPDGTMGLPASASETLQLCDSKRAGEKGRSIDLAPSGRSSISAFTCL
jgi:type IV fimbrial biogenesis protein FimT